MIVARAPLAGQRHAAAAVMAVLARGDDPPEPPDAASGTTRQPLWIIVPNG